MAQLSRPRSAKPINPGDAIFLTFGVFGTQQRRRRWIRPPIKRPMIFTLISKNERRDSLVYLRVVTVFKLLRLVGQALEIGPGCTSKFHQGYGGPHLILPHPRPERFPVAFAKRSASNSSDQVNSHICETSLKLRIIHPISNEVDFKARANILLPHFITFDFGCSDGTC